MAMVKMMMMMMITNAANHAMVLEIRNNFNGCRQFTQNNRRVYECVNTTLWSILPIPPDFGDMTRIVELDGCPWRCDCHLRDFVAFQRKTLNAKSSRCYEPIQIRNVRWDDLSLEDFACGPIITAPLQETLDITEGETASFLCIVWGDPTPIVYWYKNGSDNRLHSNGDRISVEAAAFNNGTSYHIMHIRQTVPEDQTTYWCKATTGFVTNAKGFDLRISSIKSVSTKEEEQLLLPSTGDSFSKYHGKARDQKQPVQQIQPIWQLMLKIVVLFAVVLLFVASLVLLVYWCRIQRRHEVSSDQSGEEKLLQTTIMTGHSALTTESIQNEFAEVLQIENSKLRLLQNGEPSLASGSSRSGDELARKAPLAQYDRDTSVLPLVQTSL